MNLILYSKPDCCLCLGLMEKLEQIQELDVLPPVLIEVRDITTNLNWFEKYQYEIPVLCVLKDNMEQELPRISPRSPVSKLQQLLLKYV
ncbi:Glutaredoxin-like domain (DUF836) [Synechococcus sp. PCC 7502]|uniref:glutaredoxin family protein n=1 Tax=Synechococcus sp. PCC 7502 TaxID=1173263 RepID=UPI00029FCD70|nr:glutaredoxin family protein [Synechococcus sp. PCC 7502]AFY74707.1 Glutaredoxin-like domain (DUF836) [Synechococcus sp. PCC 7502]